MRFTVNRDDDGNIECIHPRPKNECNTERSKVSNVEHLTLGELIHAVVQQEHVGLVETVDALVCQHCGGD